MTKVKNTTNEIILNGWTPATKPPKADGVYLVLKDCGPAHDPLVYDVLPFTKDLRNAGKKFSNENRPGFYDHDFEYGTFEVSYVKFWMALPKKPEKKQEVEV